MPRALYTRVLGAATTAYGTNELLRPQHLAKAVNLGNPDVASPAVRVLGAVLGVRDIASGIAMMAAPVGRPLQAAIAARVAFDVGDCIAFVIGSPGAATKAKVAGITLGWAALCASSAEWAGRG